MFGISDYPAFVAAVVVFLFIPGPGNLVVLSGAARGGLRGGLQATAGVVLADQILIWCALGGIAALLQNLPTAFAALRWGGAAYLVWLGLRMLLARGAANRTPLDRADGGFVRQGFLVTLLNPKAIVFYMAFFPLFVDPNAHRGWLTFVVMATTVALLTVVYCVAACLLVGRLAQQLRSRTWHRAVLFRLAGSLLVAFGVLLGFGF